MYVWVHQGTHVKIVNRRPKALPCQLTARPLDEAARVAGDGTGPLKDLACVFDIWVPQMVLKMMPKIENVPITAK